MTISVSELNSDHETDAPFAKKVLTARTLAGYTVEQLAVTCGLTTTEIHALEDGTDSDPSRIRRVAAALHIPVETVI
ncbi:helix-turn-helix transcriptional regulator [Agrobacterium genomosp. 3]|jgi:transcriptional regulator with XRE-family HTH domain|uniref:Helix-turn-helix transcriptional regulator n=4 Tax=Rhizobium/Agrobacterium group TaxID=227290 RepID=A0AAE6EMH7_AGRTU|nr:MULTISPECIES: helix-turn-helix domain-containing protein [Rhizobium/Agrobacterium group]MCA1865563.1 helix-turn-helix transcriptional regulator [Agrobacterium tomkonis]MCA2375343.1 helix-turn-helix transcriptional regulator [Agrobacterium tomkonis RTP8]KNY32723.1 transcriptional regulator [Agrobacterium sp. SUL3]KRA56467.1 transcriptional regulator [Rhizobium sp. Root651]MBP8938146.1 helix-turn-helix transcriptional regulator [Agrobacterium sp.]